MSIRDLDPDEDMLLLQYRLLPPEKQQEILKLLKDLHVEKAESSNSTDKHKNN